MTVKQLVLHIGAPKTGTTAIHHQLSMAHDDLKKIGILYPHTRWENNNHAVILPTVFGPSRIKPGRRPKMGNSDAEVEAFAKESLEEIKADAEACGAETIVLCSESFFREYTAEDGERFRRFCDSLANETLVTCYVRDPISDYISSTQQRLKSGFKVAQPHPIRYRRVLESLAPHIPGGLLVRKYSTGDYSSSGKNVVSDFCAAALPKALPVIEVGEGPRPNSSMSPELMACLQWLAKNTSLDRRQVRQLIEADQKLAGFSRPVAKPDVRDIITRTSMDLVWLRDTYDITFDGIDYSIASTDETRQIRAGKSILDLCDIDQTRLKRLQKRARIIVPKDETAA